LFGVDSKVIKNHKAMQNSINYVGIDISKLYFDAALPDGQGYRHERFDNNPTGFSALLTVLSRESVVIMEASGPYYT
jgi:transposase